MKGWFDSFREEGGPTLYSFHNRTAVAADVPSLTIIAAALTLYVAFLVIFPGIRKERFSTFVVVTLSLFVGTVILVCKQSSSWHVARSSVPHATYRAFSSERLDCILAVYVGLAHVNITLHASTMNNESTQDVDFNERFPWSEASAMETSYHEGLKRGLPYPILTVAEYFAVGQEGFDWGSKYRSAGYCTAVMLWAALASWLCMNLLLIVVPRYGVIAMLVTGILLMLAAMTYRSRLSGVMPPITVDGTPLVLQPGWCFYITAITGGIVLVFSCAAIAAEALCPERLVTALEVHYDTPYDRHVLLGDSKSKSQHAAHKYSIHARILRRLSSKSRPENTSAANITASVISELVGRDNPAYETAPKSPWRYPLRRPFPPPVNRMDSGSSFGSTNGAGILHLTTLNGNNPPTHRVKPQTPIERTRHNMW